MIRHLKLTARGLWEILKLLLIVAFIVAAITFAPQAAIVIFLALNLLGGAWFIGWLLSQQRGDKDEQARTE